VLDFGIEPDQEFLIYHENLQEKALDMFQGARAMCKLYIRKNGPLPPANIPLANFPDYVRPYPYIGMELFDVAYAYGLNMGKSCMYSNLHEGRNNLKECEEADAVVSEMFQACLVKATLYMNVLDYMIDDNVERYLSTVKQEELNNSIAKMFMKIKDERAILAKQGRVDEKMKRAILGGGVANDYVDVNRGGMRIIEMQRARNKKKRHK
jgi:hypothetical protein